MKVLYNILVRSIFIAIVILIASSFLKVNVIEIGTIKAYDCFIVCRDECRSQHKQLLSARCLGGNNHKCQCCARKNNAGNPGTCTWYTFSCSGTLHSCRGGTGEHYRCVHGYNCSTTSTVHMGCCKCVCVSHPINHPPTCTISFPTDGLGTVLYDAKEYYNINGSAVVKQPTTRTGKINTTDPDGDTVTVQSLTVDRNCAQLSLNGTNFALTPQGHATGVSPVDLTSPTKCTVTLTATVTDNKDTATCQKQVDIIYPPTYLIRMYIRDLNKYSSLNYENNTANNYNTKYYPSNFKYTGSTAQDIANYQIQLNNANKPTRTLKDPAHRFKILTYTKSDAAPFEVRLMFYDTNGPIDMNLPYSSRKIWLREISGAGSSNLLPLITIPSYSYVSYSGGVKRRIYIIYTYGVKRDSTIKQYNEPGWTSCMQDSQVATCINGIITYIKNSSLGYPTYAVISYRIYPKSNGLNSTPNIRLEPYFKQTKDLEGTTWLKYKTTEALNQTFVSFKDPNVKTYAADGKTWTIAPYLYIDSTPPEVTKTTITRIDANTINLQVTIKDYQPAYIPRNYWPGFIPNPIFRTYVFATNPDANKNISGVENRFLTNISNKQLKAQDTSTNNLYGWNCTTKNTTTGPEKTCNLKIKGLLGQDTLTYGFCVADNAGNARCCDSDNLTAGCSLVTGGQLTYGTSWFKTSGGIVYSNGGFSGLPSYSLISGVKEDPFTNYINPFNATQHASLSTFYIFSKASTSGILRGYNGHWNSTVISNTNFANTNWSDYLYNIAKAKCAEMDNCQEITVPSANLATALSSTSTQYKLITVNAGQNITLPEKVKVVGKNLVFIKNSTIKLYEIYKQNGINDLNNAVIFIATGNTHIIIDDNKNKDSSTDGPNGSGVLGSASTKNMDIVQAGFIILDNSTFKDIQGVADGTRDNYKDSNGDFDRLVIQGFLYSQNLPTLERDLGIERGSGHISNEHYPAEWFINDSNLLNLFSDFFGRRKIQTLNCKVVNHPICNQ